MIRFIFVTLIVIHRATPLKNYREINGYRLAGYAETIYSFPERDLCYGTFEVVSVNYNGNDLE